MQKPIYVALAVGLLIQCISPAAAVPTLTTAPGMQVIAAPVRLSYTTDGTTCGSRLGPFVSLACSALSQGGVLLYWDWIPCNGSNCVKRISGFHIYHPSGSQGSAGGVYVHTTAATPVKTVINPEQTYVFLESARPGECFQATAFQGSAESDPSGVVCLARNIAMGGSSVTLRPLANKVRSSHRGLIYSTGVSLTGGDVPSDNEELGRIHVGYSYNTSKGTTDTANNNLYRGAFAFGFDQLQGKAIQKATLHLHVLSTRLGMPPQPNYNASCARHLGRGTNEWWYSTSWLDGDFFWDLSGRGPDVDVDVTDTVRGWIQLGNPNFGFVLSGPNENIMAFTEDSCETIYGALLEIDYL